MLKNLADQLEMQKMVVHNIEAVHRCHHRCKNCGLRGTLYLPFKRKHLGPERFATKPTDIRSSMYENMSRKNQQLHWHITSKAADQEYRFEQHKEGKMFERVTAVNRPFKINNDGDLELIRQGKKQTLFYTLHCNPETQEENKRTKQRSLWMSLTCSLAFFYLPLFCYAFLSV